MILLLFIFLLGLSFGSFINVLIYRLPLGISLNGRSFCPKCKHKISCYDNIPLLSYTLLRGKCRYCTKPISIQYPIIELSTATIFLVTFLASQGLPLGGYVPYMVCLYLLIVISIAVFAIDLEYQIIPDELVYSGYILTLIYLIFFNSNYLFVNLFSGFSLALFILSINLITKGKGMGLGDVKYALLTGTFLGFPGSIIFIYIAFIAGAVTGTVLILIKLGKFGKQIAFGPFLAVSFWVTAVWGGMIWELIKEVLH